MNQIEFVTTFGNEQVKLLRSKLSFQDETIAQLQRDDDIKEEEKTKLKDQIEKLSSELQSQSECNGNLNTKVYTFLAHFCLQTYCIQCGSKIADSLAYTIIGIKAV